MKINELTPQKTEIKREIQKGRPQEQPKENEQLKITQDQVQLSIKPAIENAKAKASSLPEIREEKVSQLKEQIASGNYQVSNQQIARAMVGSLLSEIA
ncbi:flagellar biosynthesis anti-sigma factor FlgM [Caldimicrobium thiodismutans]|nr:flagellar biosynthesis anti-sigma factor FlgM [Caldimicrobium thiodismutans]